MQSKPQSVGFSMPGGECCGKAGARPIDLNHLAEQTMGDRDLELEVLALFMRESDNVVERLAGADEEEQMRLAHSLVGSARGVGAFTVAEHASEIERQGYDAARGRKLEKSLGETRDFIASICR